MVFIAQLSLPSGRVITVCQKHWLEALSFVHLQLFSEIVVTDMHSSFFWWYCILCSYLLGEIGHSLFFSCFIMIYLITITPCCVIEHKTISGTNFLWTRVKLDAWCLMLDGQTSQSQDTMMEADWRTSLLWDLITVLLSLWKAWSCTGSSDGALTATAVFPGSKLTVADEDSHLGQHAAWVFFTLPMPLNRWHGTPSSSFFYFFKVLLLLSRFSVSCTSYCHLHSLGSM